MLMKWPRDKELRKKIKERNHQEAQRERSDENARYHAQYAEIAAAIRRFVIHYKAKQKQKNRRRKKLTFRIGKKLRQYGALAAVIAAAVFSCAQWIAISGQLKTMQIQQRPWIYAMPSIKNNELTSQHEEFWLTLTFDMKNTGGSPAFNIAIEPEIIAVSSTLDPILNTLDAKQKLLCSKAKNDSITDTSAGIAVFPNISINREKATPSIEVPDGKSWYIVQGCIDYTYADGLHGKTAFRMQLKPKRTESHSPRYFVWFQEDRSEYTGDWPRRFMNADPFVFEPTDKGGNWAQ